MKSIDPYADNSYWRTHWNFHEEDAVYKAARCAEALSWEPTDRIIDIGCGSGAVLHELAAIRPGSYFGIDVSSGAIDRAKSRGSDIHFATGNATTITEKYDVAILNDVFEHVEDYIGFLRNLRHLADRFYFNIPIDMTVLSVLRHRYMYARERVGHLHYFSVPSAIATLSTAGYNLVYSQLNWHTLHQLRVDPTPRRWLAALPRLIGRTVAPNLTVHLIGGASLGLVCTPV